MSDVKCVKKESLAWPHKEEEELLFQMHCSRVIQSAAARGLPQYYMSLLLFAFSSNFKILQSIFDDSFLTCPTADKGLSCVRVLMFPCADGIVFPFRLLLRSYNSIGRILTQVKKKLLSQGTILELDIIYIHRRFS